MSKDDDGGGVLKGRFGEPSMRPRQRDFSGCQHTRIEVGIGKTRGVSCIDCGMVLDAVAVLYQYATKERRLYWQFEEGKKRLKEIEERAGELLRQEKNAKARLRRLERRIQEIES